MGRPKKIKEVKPSTKNYRFSVTINGETFTVEKPDILEAILSLPKPPKITSKVVIRAEYDGEVVEKHMMAPFARANLFNPLSVQFLAKHLRVLLHGN